MDPFPSSITKAVIEEQRKRIPENLNLIDQAKIILETMVILTYKGVDYCIIDLSEASQVIRSILFSGLAARFDRIEYYDGGDDMFWCYMTTVDGIPPRKWNELQIYPERILVWLNYHRGSTLPLNPYTVDEKKLIKYHAF